MSKDPSPTVRSARVLAFREGAARPDEREDAVAVEAPLEIRLGARTSTILMRTPGDDEDLVRGFLLSEGIAGSLAAIRSIRRPAGLDASAEGNVIAVDLAGGPPPPALRRVFAGNSACGACGKASLAALEVRGEVATSRVRIPRDVLLALPDAMRARQETFRRTGGVHASALFTAGGELVVVREDVGRHNALDKILGWGLAEGRLPFRDLVLVVSGRLSWELLQKAVVGGIPVVAAVGAPSSYAVDIAERFGITLVGFMRGAAMNVYAHGARVVDGPAAAVAHNPRKRPRTSARRRRQPADAPPSQHARRPAPSRPT